MVTVNIEDLAEKQLYCKDCGNKFIWTPGEQKFFIEKGLRNIPKRCKICASKNKEKLREKHPMWWIKCKKCGKRNEVPFDAGTEDILCEECFQKSLLIRNEKLRSIGEKVE